MAHPNEALLRKGYGAFASGDLDTLRGMFADGVLWHVPGRGPISGTYKGHDEVFAFFGKLMELSGGTLRIELHDVLADDEHAVAMATSTAERAGKSFSGRSVAVYHVANGKVTECWFFPEDIYADDEFWS